MRMKLFTGVALVAFMIPGAAYAQSTGSVDFDNDIVVTGNRATDVGGIEIPDSPKAKVVVGKELIRHQTPGQTINEMLNLVPGVSFTNNDPWGSAGGNFTIRGFNSDRISQTFDGVPLNDTGNYAVYTNQQVDPELIESVNVNLGSTDVDSPTAAAVGGTVNINTIKPTDEFGVMMVGSYGNIVADGAGDRPYMRIFGLVQTGDLTGMGTKAWFSASTAHNEAAFANYGVVDKQQYNAKIWQDIGSNGDFISISGHYNQNRNNFGGSPFSLQAITGDKSVRFYDVGVAPNGTTPAGGGGYPCFVSTNSTANNCGTEFERRYNPSNTGNIRLNSRFTLTDKLTLTVDGAFQYTKANGGGTVKANERFFTVGTTNYTGFFGGNAYFGRDLNGDGQIGTVTVLAPSQTLTRRYTGIANLSYDFDDANRLRLVYTYDRGRHRQTGETGALYANGEPMDVFSVNNPLTDANGNVLQKRDRLSYATLNQIAGEYRGKFFDDKLVTQIGLTMKFFARGLNQNCLTTSATGFVDCIAGGDPAAYLAANPYAQSVKGKPSGALTATSRDYNYKKLLPNIGITYNFTPAISVAANYAKNLSVPGTDTLYDSLYVPASNPAAKPLAENSDSYDLSLRYKTGIVQAAVTGWYSTYVNRIVSAYDIDCDCAVDTNLGKVKKYGIDANISVQPVPQLLIYAFGSYLGSEIQDDVLGAGGTVSAPTAGKRERNAPEWMYGGRIQGSIGGFDLGAQVKHTGSRFLNDINSFSVPGYTVVDLDARYAIAEKTYLQLNVSNLFDKFYIGSFSGGLTTASSSFVNFGSPRAITGSVIVGF